VRSFSEKKATNYELNPIRKPKTINKSAVNALLGVNMITTLGECRFCASNTTYQTLNDQIMNTSGKRFDASGQNLRCNIQTKVLFPVVVSRWASFK